MVSPSNEQLLASCLDRLRKQSFLEYSGEFGAEITTFMPFVAWLKREGELKGKRIKTYTGMRPYYFFLDDDEIEFTDARRKWLPYNQRYWPSNASHEATASPWHAYPDYRAQFSQRPIALKRPTIFIQNKFTVDFKEGPINYIPLRSLQRLLERSQGKFDLVYSRPQDGIRNFVDDKNYYCEYPDRSLVRLFPHVMDLETHVAKNDLDYNDFKLRVLAQCYLFVAVQGGGSHLLACFGDSFLAMLHRLGPEYPHAYKNGPYQYLSANPPKMLIAQSTLDFELAISLILKAEWKDGKVHLPEDSMLEQAAPL